MKDSQGREVGRHDFLPFGEEWPAATTTEEALHKARNATRRPFGGRESDATGLPAAVAADKPQPWYPVQPASSSCRVSPGHDDRNAAESGRARGALPAASSMLAVRCL